MMWLRSVCDRIKSIISGNEIVGIGVDNGGTINSSPRNDHYVSINDKDNNQAQFPESNQLTNQELLELLQGV